MSPGADRVRQKLERQRARPPLDLVARSLAYLGVEAAKNWFPPGTAESVAKAWTFRWLEAGISDPELPRFVEEKGLAALHLKGYGGQHDSFFEPFVSDALVWLWPHGEASTPLPCPAPPPLPPVAPAPAPSPPEMPLLTAGA